MEMTTPEKAQYEFDVAVSFAGEDREFVEEIVTRLKEAGKRVYYDTDYQAAMWGEDLVEYLDSVYRLKARYSIIFISRFYDEKMWTRLERRSAWARALQERAAYVLPVRLDDQPIAGLSPTIGYLDARVMGVDGIVSTTLAKLEGTEPAETAAITQVPRTEAERQNVLLARPSGWEFLYFAGQLLHERKKIEPKYLDFEVGYAPTSAETVSRAEMPAYLGRQADNAKRLAHRLVTLVTDDTARERAFGAAGQAGDPDRLAHLAKRWNSAYEEFMDWSGGLRGVSAPSEFHTLLDLLARYSEGPIQQYREFVDEYVEQIDSLPAAIAAGTQPKIEMALTVSIPDEISDAYKAEFDRVKNEFR
jgi:hypothetical protein